MQAKLKMCAGFDGNSHEAYIYKNISGKKYCKSCTFKLEPPKPLFKITAIKKVSDKQKTKNEERRLLLEEDKKFYLRCWEDRFMYFESEYGGGAEYCVTPKCECCGEFLGYEPNLMFFHHILEKRNYPEHRHDSKNIAIVCAECHNRYETYPDKVPYLVKKRKELITFYIYKNEQQKTDTKRDSGSLTESAS